jgi:SAM-dependent methyltransferase
VRSDDWAARAASFGSVADAYERARPGYPEEAVCWLAGTPPRDVLDLGAGTGKLTRSLVSAGHRVVAVDRSPEMLAQLSQSVPGTTVHVGRAEEIPLEDASVDVVTVAQAFHWFDYERAVPEIARVLRPGGTLGLIWNGRDESEPWVARLSKAIGEEWPEGDERWLDTALAHGPFGPLEEATFGFAQRLDRAALVELVLSRSHCATRTPPEREAVLAAVGELYDEVADADGVVLPYVTWAHRAVMSATGARSSSGPHP